MAVNAKTGRELINILAPILGYDNLSAIRSVTLHMDHNDIAWMEIARLADGDPESIRVIEGKTCPDVKRKERYQITVEKV